MRNIAIYTSSASVLKHLRQSVAPLHHCDSAAALGTFLRNSPNATVILHCGTLSQTPAEEFAALLAKDYPSCCMVALSDHPSFDEGIRLLQAGAKGYANSYMGEQHYAQMLAMAAEGKVWVYPEFMQQLIGQAVTPQANRTNEAVLGQLTPREREIALMVRDNRSNQQIADETDITVRTVKQHLTNIYEKLGIKDRLSLALLLKEA